MGKQPGVGIIIDQHKPYRHPFYPSIREMKLNQVNEWMPLRLFVLSCLVVVVVVEGKAWAWQSINKEWNHIFSDAKNQQINQVLPLASLRIFAFISNIIHFEIRLLLWSWVRRRTLIIITVIW